MMRSSELGNEELAHLNPDLANSLRVKLLARNPFARSIARSLVHRFPTLWDRVSGAYAGPVELSILGTKLRYFLGVNDTIGDVIYWRGGNCWEPEVTPVFLQLAKEARGYILDMGANFGVYSLLSCAANPTAKVIAWEPVPFIRQRLLLNVSANNFQDRVICRDAALASHPGEAQFFLRQDATMGSLSDGVGQIGAIPVRLERADDAVPADTPVGLVKIDVEGHDHDALLGMRRIMHEHHPPILFECLNPAAWDLTVPILRDHGYQIFQLQKGSTSPCANFVPGSTNYLAKH